MSRRLLLPVVALLALVLAGCHNKKVVNPIADVGSKQPDKVLFDRAMDAMKHNHYDVARLTLQTLINTYPDSEYIARAKLAVGDSWYAEGGGAALAQAENEYRDFETFFPNMPEAAEAQLKIADIHFRQMEKPDRDYTHAKSAEEEYRQLILQYPDSKLVPQAKEKLREVQEVLAEREFQIGRFYYLRESWAAAIARLQSLVDTYPLYSGADEALYMLGGIYEKEIEGVRASKFDEPTKGKLIKQFTDQAAAAYDRIITRYPVMGRAEDAKRRLEALHRPVPVPSKQAVAQNQAEEDSRREPGMFSRFMDNMHRRPDTSMASQVGEPTLQEPKQTSAPQVVKDTNTALANAVAGSQGGNQQVSIEQVGTGAPPPSQPTPRSDNPPSEAPAPAPDNAAPAPATPGATAPTALPPGSSAGSSPAASSGDTGIPELKPLTDQGSSDSPSPSGAAQAPPVPPAQINEADTDQQVSGAPAQSTDNGNVSSSSRKKKKKRFF